MAVSYNYEEGHIEKEGTNRLTDIAHEDSVYDFYLLHSDLNEVWELGETMENSSSPAHKRAGRAIKRVMMMLVREKMTRNAGNLLDYAKSLNRKIMVNSVDPIRKELAVEFAFNTIKKGFAIWEEQMISG